MQRKEQWVALPGSAVAFVHSDWQRPLATAGLSNTTDFFDAIGEPLSKPGLGKRYRARLVASRESDDHILVLETLSIGAVRFPRKTMVRRCVVQHAGPSRYPGRFRSGPAWHFRA